MHAKGLTGVYFFTVNPMFEANKNAIHYFIFYLLYQFLHMRKIGVQYMIT